MVDYKEMYFKLYRETGKAIELLKQVQIECEELYISATDAEITVLEQPNEE